MLKPGIQDIRTKCFTGLMIASDYLTLLLSLPHLGTNTIEIHVFMVLSLDNILPASKWTMNSTEKNESLWMISEPLRKLCMHISYFKCYNDAAKMIKYPSCLRSLNAFPIFILGEERYLRVVSMGAANEKTRTEYI